MSTATAEPTTAQIAFISKGPDQVLTRRPVRNLTDPETGEKRFITEAEWRARQEELNDKRIERGEDPVTIDDAPWKVEFVDGMYVVPDDLSDEGRETLLKFLRNHRLFNTSRGFYEQVVGGPSETEQLAEVGEAAGLGDIERVESVLEVEKKTHNRESILVAAGAALTGLRRLELGVPGNKAGHDGDAGEPRPDQDPPQ